MDCYVYDNRVRLGCLATTGVSFEWSLPATDLMIVYTKPIGTRHHLALRDGFLLLRYDYLIGCYFKDFVGFLCVVWPIHIHGHLEPN